jgi:uncharacterized metal-binding protein
LDITSTLIKGDNKKDYLVLTAMGIEKNKDIDLKHLDVRKVKEEIKKICYGEAA